MPRGSRGLVGCSTPPDLIGDGHDRSPGRQGRIGDGGLARPSATAIVTAPRRRGGCRGRQLCRLRGAGRGGVESRRGRRRSRPRVQRPTRPTPARWPGSWRRPTTAPGELKTSSSNSAGLALMGAVEGSIARPRGLRPAVIGRQTSRASPPRCGPPCRCWHEGARSISIGSVGSAGRHHCRVGATSSAAKAAVAAYTRAWARRPRAARHHRQRRCCPGPSTPTPARPHPPMPRRSRASRRCSGTGSRTSSPAQWRSWRAPTSRLRLRRGPDRRAAGCRP